MGDEDQGQAKLFAEVIQQVDDLGADRDVKSGDRFVADEQLRVHDERAGDADTLALAAREFVRIAGSVLGNEADLFEDFADLLVVLGLVVMALDVEAFLDDVFDRHAGVEGVDRVLEDHLDLVHQVLRRVALVVVDLVDLATLGLHGFAKVLRGRFDLLIRLGADLGHLLLVIGGGIVEGGDARGGLFLEALDELAMADPRPLDLLLVPAAARTDAETAVIDGARSRVIEADDGTSGRRLAASGFADDAEAFAFVDVEGDVGDGFELLVMDLRPEEEELFQAADGEEDVRVHELGAFFDVDALLVDLDLGLGFFGVSLPGLLEGLQLFVVGLLGFFLGFLVG